MIRPRIHAPMLAHMLVPVSLLFAMAVSSRAQDSPKEKTTRAEKPFVRLNVIVTDAKDRTVTDVKREDLRVYEDGVEQPIAYFAKEEQPVSYGLVIDNSGSMRTQIGYVIASAKSVVNGNAPDDETFIVRFISADKITQPRGFTNNKGALEKALEQMYVEGGQTALVDALYVSADYLIKYVKPAEAKPRRHILVLISDGEDRASFYKADDLIKLLKQSDIQIFCIGLVAGLEKERGFTSQSKREKSTKLLKLLANETGGRVFFAEKVGELKEAVGEIISNLHTQYVVGYDSPATAGGETKHKIEVKIVDAPGRKKLIALVRPERTVAGDAGAETQKKQD